MGEPDSSLTEPSNHRTMEDFSGNDKASTGDAKEQESDLTKLEHSAALSFVRFFSNHYNNINLTFHVCSFEDAIKQISSPSCKKRKILLLYLHNENDTFSQSFCSILTEPDAQELMENSFFLLGWDTGKSEWNEELCEVLNTRLKIADYGILVKNQTAAAILMIPVGESIQVITCERGDLGGREIFDSLKRAENLYLPATDDCGSFSDRKDSVSKMSSTDFQQLMLDLLGDRDYDLFEHHQHYLLSLKIGFSLFGPPVQEHYTEKQTKKIQRIFNTILTTSNQFSEWRDRITISFIFNCIEPLKDHCDAQLSPIPIFVLRKCKDKKNHCRLFIDNYGKLYDNWEEYIRKNKLPKCKMILPKNGQYTADANGNVIVEEHSSPACTVKCSTKTANTSNVLIMSTLFVLTAPFLVWPFVACIPGGVGLGLSCYTINRSVGNKKKFAKCFTNIQTRSGYSNLIETSLGSSKSLTCPTQGENLEKASPKSSSRIMINLHSAILYFGQIDMAKNLKNTVMSDNKSPLDILNMVRHYLFNNRLRKAVNTFYFEDTTHEENVIVLPVRLMEDKNEIGATLIKAATYFKEKGVMIWVENGEVKLNGVDIDMKKFYALDKNEITTLLSSRTSNEPKITQTEVKNLRIQLSEHFNDIGIAETAILASNISKLLHGSSTDIRNKIIDGAIAILEELRKEPFDYMNVLSKIFPNKCFMYFQFFKMVGGFYQSLVNQTEMQYQQWKKDGSFEDPMFFSLVADQRRRSVQVFNYVSREYFFGNQLTAKGLAELKNYTFLWISKIMYIYTKELEETQKKILYNNSHSQKRKTVSCRKCGGVYHS